MAFEKVVPKWNAEGIEPPDSLKNSGFQVGYKPPADYFNWFWHNIGASVTELQNKAFSLGGVYTGDMNELVLPGQYRVQSNVNLPSDGYYGQAFVGRSVISGGNNDTVTQLVIGYQGKAMMCYRGGQLRDGAWTWTDWNFSYSNLNKPNLNGVAWLGLNPIKTPAEDTAVNWQALGSGFAQYSALDQLNDQPSRYGFVITYTYGSDVSQTWHTLPSGAIYTRSGNASGWGKSWTKLYDTANKPSPAELGAPSLSGGTYIQDGTDLNTIKTPGNYHCSGDANAATLVNCPVIHAFRMRVGYATGNTSYIYQELFDWVTGTRFYRQCLASSDVWSDWIQTFDSSSGNIGGVSFLGENPITTPAEDLTANWVELGSGYAWYTGHDQLTDQPSQYGFLVSYVYDKDVFQMWKCQWNGQMYFRGGNADGWGTTWQQVISAAGGEITGTLVLSKTTEASETADNGPALVVGGSRTSTHLELDANEIIAKSNGTAQTLLNVGESKVASYGEGIDNTNQPRIRNIYAGTSGMTSGTTSLATGRIYLQYE